MKNRKPKRRLYAPLVVLLGLGTSGFIVASEEDSPLPVAVLQPPLVQTEMVTYGPQELSVNGWGFVEAKDHIALRPEVRGSVIELASNIVPGAQVSEGQFLFRIDPRAYEIELAQSRAAVEQAIQLLEVERGQQNVARAELELLTKEFPEAAADRSLALRVPQLREKEAVIELERARLRQAELNIEHTEVRSPCTGRITSEALAIGSYLDAGASSLEIACLDSQRVFASFTASDVVDQGRTDAIVRYNDREIPATVISILPQIDEKTRQRVAVVEWTGFEVPLGAQVEVVLPGAVFSSAFSLPSTALRQNNTVWLLSPDAELQIRPVEVLGTDSDYTVIGAGISDGDQVILSHISNPIEGLRVRTDETQLAARASQ